MHLLSDGQIDHLLAHVKQIVETALFDIFKNDDDVWNLWHDTHEEANVWMSQDALHDNLVLDLLQKSVCDVRVKDFLDSYRSSITIAFVND